MIAKNLIVLVALAVVAFVGAYSWFSKTTTASAQGINASTKMNDKLEFYIMPPSDTDQYNAIKKRFVDNAAWNAEHSSETPRRTDWHHGELNFDFSDQEFKFMDGLFMSEVTGDGVSFNIPKLMQYDNVAYIDKTQAFEKATPNDNYMSFDLYIRSKNNYSIALMNDSSIEPVNSNSISGQHDYTGDAAEANMKPGAIGAVRMSILNCEANNERELLWIPAPNVWYNGLTDHLYTGLTANSSGDYSFSGKGSAYYDENDATNKLKLTNEGTTTHAFYSANNANRTTWANGSNKVKASTAGNYQLGSDNTDDIVVLTLQNQDNDYRYGRIRVNLWIEGEDSEARLRLVNGKFNMSLRFDIKETATEPGS
ncbi:hypothetical protein [uncultured Ruminococcus sp.]|uniref:hypothetical protein n=1 Tax=uncultured Ruminococcus sp. TaxID=165186 RepID=UPI002930FEDF|nr:hypothetical protein [uncultured Ruminococcus sp.]